MNKRRIVAKWILFAFAMIVTIFIIVNSCMNGNQSGASSSRLADLCKNIINFFKHDLINDTNYETFHSVIRKLVGHFGLFMMDAIFLSWSLYLFDMKKWWYKIIISLSFGLFIALISEFTQIFVPGRVGSYLDILIDYSGYILGFSVIFLVGYIKYRKNKS